jgi:hypothetical protein
VTLEALELLWKAQVYSGSSGSSRALWRASQSKIYFADGGSYWL